MKRDEHFFRAIRTQFQLRVNQEFQAYLFKTLRDLVFLAIEFFLENLALQIISSVPHIQMPLRDLGYELLVNLRVYHIAYLSYQISIEQIAVLWIVFCFFHGNLGITILQKGARCLTIVRSLRICLFSLLVLPSPKPHCRFIGPIDPFRLRVDGACNDLLYSGHVTVYTITGLSITVLSKSYPSKVTRYLLRFLVWFYLTQRIVCTILERHHYSIDMFLGLIVTLLVWQCEIFYYDLPKVPKNLFLHLKHLFAPRYPSSATLKEV